jgi:dephospho-CoA kinase
MKRDGSSQEDASSRLNSQTSIEEKVTYADEIIDNSNGITALEEKVKSFVRRMELEIGWTWMLSWFSPPFAILSGGFCLARRAWQRSKSQKNTR